MLVLLAGVEWDGVRGTDRHLAGHLQRSVPVLWVDPPMSVVRAVKGGDISRRRGPATPEQVDDNIWRLSLLTPPLPTRTGFSQLARFSMQHTLSRHVLRGDIRVVGVLGTAPHVSLEVVKVKAGVRRVYYATDDFVAGAALMGLSPKTVASDERTRLREADAVGAVSPLILERWGDLGNGGTVVHNGCEPDYYAGVEHAPMPEDVTLPPPIAGMVGQLSARIDLRYLEAIAEADVSLLLVGPWQPGFEPERVARLLARDNVQWVGPKPFESLPSYLRMIDVGLTPYALSDFNNASFPLKTLEYLAAGRPVVSTPLPAVDVLGSSWVHTAETPGNFASLVRALGEVPRTDEDFSARRSFAQMHSWSSRAGEILKLLWLD